MKKLKAFGYQVKDLQEQDTEAMFLLFSEYYANVSREQFRNDLLKKDHIFILKDQKTLDIKGFSTIVALQLTVQGQKVRGFFSGDTVVDKEYWGQGTLGVAFLKFLFMQKLKKPMSPLYWFLISKGYKTYLLMANNFATHYPRYEEKAPSDMQEIIDGFSKQLYPQNYSAQTGVISFTEDATLLKDALKEDITPISLELMKHPRIAFFAESNPGWLHGDELACIAKMTFSMPIYYQIKTMKKLWKKSFGTGKKAAKHSTLPSKETEHEKSKIG